MDAVTTPSSGAGKSVEDISYEDLYRRWERGNWRASEIDFSVDRDDWRNRMSEQERTAALFNWTLFLHGEDAVADGLGPYIDAAPREEQKYFLATQQVDEARHAVFFARFFQEVVGDTPGDVAATLGATRDQLTSGWSKMFGRLERVADELRRAPTLPNLAAGVALYHIVIEAMLAQPAQHIFDAYLERSGYLPGFHAGMRNVALDEQRHIGFGVKLLSELARDPECRQAAEDMLREVLEYGVTVGEPPGGDHALYFDSLGFTQHDLFEASIASLMQKLKMAGMPVESLHGAFPFPPGISPAEAADRSLRLQRGNLLGDRRGDVARDPETVEAMFETMSWALDHRHAPPGRTVIEWNLTDLEPWHLVIDNGASAARRGAAAEADLRLTATFDDFADVFAGRADPTKLLLRRKIKRKGSVRVLLRMQKMFR